MFFREQNPLAHFDFTEVKSEPLYNDPEVSNPLRFRKVTDRLGAELFPGLNVYTQRAKYFGLILFWAKQGWLKPGSPVHRLDQLVVMAHLINDPEGDSTGVVGKDTYGPYCQLNRTNLQPTDQCVETSSVKMYARPMKALGLLTGANELTDLGASLLNSLEFSSGSRFLKAINSFIYRNHALPRKFFHRLAKWDVNELPVSYSAKLAEILGLRGDQPFDRNRRALGAMLQLLQAMKVHRNGSTKFRQIRNGAVDHFIRSAPNLEQDLPYFNWIGSPDFRYLTKTPLLSLYKIDRTIFFLQSFFEVIFMQASHSGAPKVDLRILLGPLANITAIPQNSFVEKLRIRMCARGDRLASKFPQGTNMKVSDFQAHRLLNDAWMGLVVTRTLYPNELKVILDSICVDLEVPINPKAISSGSPLETAVELIRLHIEYTKIRRVAPWLVLDADYVETDMADTRFRPAFFSLGPQGGKGLFSYRLARVARLLEDLA